MVETKIRILIGAKGFLSVSYNSGNSTEAEYINQALLYKKGQVNYLEISSHLIPPLIFKGNRIEYQDSIITIYAEKYNDRIYIEFTAPYSYRDDSQYRQNDEDYLKMKTSKSFLYLTK